MTCCAIGASYIGEFVEIKIIKYSLVRALSQPMPLEGQVFLHSLMFIEDCSLRELLVLSH